MATVTLDRAWLSLASSPSTSLACYTSDRTDSISLPGEVRRMAGGRLRTVTRAGTATTLGVTLRMLTPTQVELVKSWLGQVVLFRDVTGRRLFCTYFGAEVGDYPDRGAQDVKLVLTEVTYVEAV